MQRTDILTVANLALLLLFPAAWFAPLMEAGTLMFFDSTQISIAGGVIELWSEEPALAAIVALFAIVMPYTKTIVLAAVHFGRLGPGALPAVEVIGKLSMADVFLIALYIVAVKGALIVSVEGQWGLWLFTACVLASIAISHVTHRRMRG